MLSSWHRYRYKNLTYLFVSLLVSFFLLRNESFRDFLLRLGNLGYFGAFIAGILFVFTFTAPFSSVILLLLAEYLSPLEIGLIAGLGAVAGDAIIFQFIRSKGLANEIKHLFEYFGGDKISHLLHTRYFSWTLPVVGALIIASPLPDELGVSLMGVSQMKPAQFLVVSFLLNSVGIFLIISASVVFKP